MRTDNINPCHTTLLLPHQPGREVYKRITEAVTPLPHLAVKSTLPKPSESSGLLEHQPLAFLHGPATNLPLLQTPMIQFVWTHCALGTLH